MARRVRMSVDEFRTKLELLGFKHDPSVSNGAYSRVFNKNFAIAILTSARDVTVFVQKASLEEPIRLRFRHRWDDALEYLQQEVTRHER